jgi:glycosyltransferase involved in cell wall biosynthesis
MEKQRKQRILVFIDWYLPGYKAGGPVRSMANMTAHLASEFDFYIVTRNTEYGESEPYTTVRADSWNNVQPGVQVWYASHGRTSLTRWRKLIQAVKPDVVYINGIYSPLFSLLPLVAARLLKWPQIIVAPRGMLAKSAIRLKRGKKELFLMAAARIGFYRRVCWHVTNEAEGAQVTALFGENVKMVVAANLARKVLPETGTCHKEPGLLRLCCFARIAPEKNTLYAIECLQLIKEKVQVEFHLYGQIYNQSYWKECLLAMEQLPQGITVTHKGSVEPEAISETLRQYHLLFLPSRGENFGHVILESLMAGRPVLISDQTPWQGLSSKKAGLDLPLDNKQRYASAIIQFAGMTQVLFDEWSKGARQLGRNVAEDRLLVKKYVEMFGGNKTNE